MPDPEIVITLHFADHNSQPTYTYTKTGTSGTVDQNGNIDFVGKEDRDVKIVFQIDPTHQGDIEFIPGKPTGTTFYSLRSLNLPLYTNNKIEFKYKLTSSRPKSEFKCDALCMQNKDLSKIVTVYDNTVGDHVFDLRPYTVYGFKFRTKESTGWKERNTEDPGIKNGGVSFVGGASVIVTALVVLAIGAILARGLWRRFTRRRGSAAS
jgi:hypothetical protein